MKKFLPLALIALVAAGGWFWWQKGNAVAADDLVLFGNVDIRQVALAFNGSGRITELSAQEGDKVRAGDIIGRLDVQSLDLQAKAQEALVEAQRQALLQLRSGPRPEEIAQARAVLASAEASGVAAQSEYDRIVRLAASRSGVASQQSLEQATADAGKAKALVDQARASLDLLLAGARAEAIAGAEAQLQAAGAQLDLLHYQIDQGALRVPQDATIRSRLREPGDMVTAQSPVYALALTLPKWVRVYVREADLGRIQPGMAAEVTADSQPGQPLKGKVGYISSVAEFTPKTVQTEELRTSLVYEVHVMIDDTADLLRLGQPVTVRLAVAAAP